MITKKIVKAEIDKIQDRYLDILYQIIKAFEISSDNDLSETEQKDLHTLRKSSRQKWLEFIDKTYGCLGDSPIERGDQGSFEIRKEMQ